MKKKWILLVFLLVIVTCSQLILSYVKVTNSLIRDRYTVKITGSESSLTIIISDKTIELPARSDFTLELMKGETAQIFQEYGYSYRLVRGKEVTTIRIPVIEVRLEYGEDKTS